MAFRGQHKHNLDAKDRITVPASYRAALSEGVVLIEGVEKCVEVYPAAAAEAMEATYLNPLSPMGLDGRRMKRRFFALSESSEIDTAGRVRMPEHLIENAGLEGTCLIVGVGDHLEIWNPMEWANESEQFQSQTAELTERMASQAGPANAQTTTG